MDKVSSFFKDTIYPGKTCKIESEQEAVLFISRRNVQINKHFLRLIIKSASWD